MSLPRKPCSAASTEPGPDGAILSEVDADNMYNFDQKCRVKAIERAVEEGVEAKLSINFLPNAVYEPANCIRTTLFASEKYGFPTDKIIFEFIETEEVKDFDHIKGIMDEYRKYGFQIALDDFGSGFADLDYLTRLQPNIVKLDRSLCANLENDSQKCRTISDMVDMCRSMGMTLIAEGIETRDELAKLSEMGIRYMQGYYLARPKLPGLARDCSHIIL